MLIIVLVVRLLIYIFDVKGKKIKVLIIAFDWLVGSDLNFFDYVIDFLEKYRQEI